MPRIDDRTKRQILTARQIESLILASRSPTERALVGLLALAGLRVSEVSRLDVDDISDHQIRVREAKGGKTRAVPISDSLRAALDKLLSGRRPSAAGSPPALLNGEGPFGGRFQPRELRERLSKIARRVGLRTTPHALRHSFAVDSLRRRGAVHELRAILGHRSLNTTAIYVDHINLESLAKRMPPMPA